MMARQPELQQKLFHRRINLDQRIRGDYVLRQIAQQIDFNLSSSTMKSRTPMGSTVTSRCRRR